MDDALLQHLAQLIALRTGVQAGTVSRDKLERSMGPFFARQSRAEVLHRLADPLSPASAALLEAASVGETYFFRHPEQFQWVVAHWLTSWQARGKPSLAAWSAGTATGEEAYSLASTLCATLGPPAVQVLGTDLLASALASAAEGSYGKWSVRSSGPLLYPVVQPRGERFWVLPVVRSRTSFAQHNLLAPPPGRFDLIFCRNVLLYFSPDAAKVALTHLASALEPDGLMVFGVMDVPDESWGLHRVGPPELNCFSHRRQQARKRTAASAAQPAPPEEPAAPKVDPVKLHTHALELIERGHARKAERELAELLRAQPDYLAGVLELALLHGRQGRVTRATEMMRDLLARLEGRAESDLVPGPESLPVAFFRASAMAYLSRHP